MLLAVMSWIVFPILVVILALLEAPSRNAGKTSLHPLVLLLTFISAILIGVGIFSAPASVGTWVSFAVAVVAGVAVWALRRRSEQEPRA